MESFRARVASSRSKGYARTSGRYPYRQNGKREWLLPGFQHGIGRARLDAVGGEERSADVARPERIAARHPAGLLECVHGEAACPLEPLLVLRPSNALRKAHPLPAVPWQSDEPFSS